MEDKLKEIELKINNLRNLIDIAHCFVEQAQDDDTNFGIFSSISEIIKNNMDEICSDYLKMSDEYFYAHTLPNLNN